MLLLLDVDFVTFGLLPATDNVLAFFLPLRMAWSMRLVSRLGLDQLEYALFPSKLFHVFTH